MSFHSRVLQRMRLSRSSKSAKICIILDHFESFLSSSAMDPYSPVLNASEKIVIFFERQERIPLPFSEHTVQQ